MSRLFHSLAVLVAVCVLGTVAVAQDKEQAFVKPSLNAVDKVQNSLHELGYEFADSKDMQAGQLSVKLTETAVVMDGRVYSDGEIEEISQVLSTMGWNVLKSGDKPEPGKVNCVFKVKTLPSQIAVDVAFVGISKREADTLGATGTPTLTLNMSGTYDLIKKALVGNEKATINGNLTQTLSFLAENGITRIHQAGTVTFTNGGSGNLKVGGTLFVKVAGQNNGDLKEVPYGFEMTIGGRQSNHKSFDLTFDLVTSEIVDPNAANIDRPEHKVKTARICEANMTTVLGGYKGVTDKIKNSGFPGLQNIPVVKWFVSQDQNVKNEISLLILVSPRVDDMKSSGTITIEPTQNPKAFANEASKDAETIREENKEGVSSWGIWPWNWF